MRTEKKDLCYSVVIMYAKNEDSFQLLKVMYQNLDVSRRIGEATNNESGVKVSEFEYRFTNCFLFDQNRFILVTSQFIFLLDDDFNKLKKLSVKTLEKEIQAIHCCELIPSATEKTSYIISFQIHQVSIQCSIAQFCS